MSDDDKMSKGQHYQELASLTNTMANLIENTSITKAQANRDKEQAEKKLRAQTIAASEESALLVAQIQNLRQILSRPLMDIIQENHELSEMYKKQQEILKKWVASQETYKKLALEYSEKLGITHEEVKKIYQEIIETEEIQNIAERKVYK